MHYAPIFSFTCIVLCAFENEVVLLEQVGRVDYTRAVLEETFECSKFPLSDRALGSFSAAWRFRV